MHLRLSRVAETTLVAAIIFGAAPGLVAAQDDSRVSWAGFSAADHHRRAQAHLPPGHRAANPVRPIFERGRLAAVSPARRTRP